MAYSQFNQIHKKNSRKVLGNCTQSVSLRITVRKDYWPALLEVKQRFIMKKERNLLRLLTDEECLEASRKAFLTADLHRNSAEILAKEKNYGIPVSHLILSTEQSVIGLLLYSQYLGINLRNISGVHLFFTDHIIKHQLATVVSFTYRILKLMIGIGEKMRQKSHDANVKLEYSELEEALLAKDQEKVQYFFQDLPQLLDWWDEANMQKNKGFYVDYSESLESPLEISETEYKRAFLIVDNFQKQIMETVSYFEKLNLEDKIEFRKNSKNLGIEKVFLQVIEARKKEMRNKNKNPKDLMKELMDGINKTNPTKND